MPRASIIIPTHCRPELLPRAVESARTAGTGVEIIVVDDASTDGTAAVCRTLKHIKYIRLERNQGVAGARNVGILASTSKYVAFLDDDDLRLPGSLDLQTAELENNPEAGFVCGAMLIADQNYNLTGEVSTPGHDGGDIFWELLELAFPIMPLGVVIRKDCFQRVGLLNRRLRGVDDWDILVRIAELYPAMVMKEPVGIYRRPTPHSAQGSSAQAAQLFAAVQHQRQLFPFAARTGCSEASAPANASSYDQSGCGHAFVERGQAFAGAVVWIRLGKRSYRAATKSSAPFATACPCQGAGAAVAHGQEHLRLFARGVWSSRQTKV